MSSYQKLRPTAGRAFVGYTTISEQISCKLTKRVANLGLGFLIVTL
jgi:hypothetical protein